MILGIFISVIFQHYMQDIWKIMDFFIKYQIKLKILLVGSELYTIPAFNPTYDDSLIHPQQTVTFFVLSSMRPPPGSGYQHSLTDNPYP